MCARGVSTPSCSVSPCYYLISWFFALLSHGHSCNLGTLPYHFSREECAQMGAYETRSLLPGTTSRSETVFITSDP